jgi:hypothetical protein
MHNRDIAWLHRGLYCSVIVALFFMCFSKKNKIIVGCLFFYFFAPKAIGFG